MGIGKRGGKQPGAGRPLGSKNKQTQERRKVEQALHQAIMNKAHRLLRAMMLQAEGEFFLMRIDETDTDKGKTKRVHNIVDDWREVKEFFNQEAQDISSQDEIEGLSGKVEGNYYYIKKVPADWRAIESLFDRVFGKSTQHISTEDGDNEKDNYDQLNEEQLDRHIDDLKQRITKATEAQGTESEDNDSGKSEGEPEK